eukprot:3939537-Rhodomonas_salina.1
MSGEPKCSEGRSAGADWGLKAGISRSHDVCPAVAALLGESSSSARLHVSLCPAATPVEAWLTGRDLFFMCSRIHGAPLVVALSCECSASAALVSPCQPLLAERPFPPSSAVFSGADPDGWPPAHECRLSWISTLCVSCAWSKPLLILRARALQQRHCFALITTRQLPSAFFLQSVAWSCHITFPRHTLLETFPTTSEPSSGGSGYRKYVAHTVTLQK